MRSKVFIALFLVGICFAALFAAWLVPKHYEFTEVCYRPGPASCAQLGFAPPEDFKAVRYAASADADAVGPFVWRIRVAIYEQTVYSLEREILVFPGFLRERQSQIFGKVSTTFKPLPEGAIVDVNLESEKRTYWVLLRNAP